MVKQLLSLLIVLVTAAASAQPEISAPIHTAKKEGSSSFRNIYTRNAAGTQTSSIDGQTGIATFLGLNTTPLNPAMLNAPVPVTKGGTGLVALGTPGQIMQVNAGATALEYTNPAAGSSPDKTFVVSPVGGDYTTIQAAVDAVPDVDTTNRYLIKVYPGTYVEEVDLDHPNISIVGSDVSSVVIEHDNTGAKTDRAITVTADDCTIANLTVYNPSSTYAAETIWVGTKTGGVGIAAVGFKAYNCRFLSPNHSDSIFVVQDCQAEFYGCYAKSHGDTVAGFDGSDYTLKDCIIESSVGAFTYTAGGTIRAYDVTCVGAAFGFNSIFNLNGTCTLIADNISCEDNETFRPVFNVNSAGDDCTVYLGQISGAAGYLNALSGTVSLTRIFQYGSNHVTAPFYGFPGDDGFPATVTASNGQDGDGVEVGGDGGNVTITAGLGGADGGAGSGADGVITLASSVVASALFDATVGININGTQLADASGEIPDGRLSANVPLKNTANTFTLDQLFSGAINVGNSSGTSDGVIYFQTGSGSTINNAYLTTDANFVTLGIGANASATNKIIRLAGPSGEASIVRIQSVGGSALAALNIQGTGTNAAVQNFLIPTGTGTVEQRLYWPTSSGSSNNSHYVSFAPTSTVFDMNIFDTTADRTVQIRNSNATYKAHLTLEANAAIGERLAVGTGTLATAGAMLQIAGTYSTALSNKTTGYTVLDTDGVITADATGGVFNVTLPTAVGRTGVRYTVVKTDASGNAVTINTTSSQNINAATTYALATQYEYATVCSNGTQWYVVAND
jgi:hypothetical protein